MELPLSPQIHSQKATCTTFFSCAVYLQFFTKLDKTTYRSLCSNDPRGPGGEFKVEMVGVVLEGRGEGNGEASIWRSNRNSIHHQPQTKIPLVISIKNPPKNVS
ncbi:hypothetical protein PAXRUDRAFT_833825 [Paxillus rubicundulus Ve08.2h10]|uniref:Uncharacterized protein n=1 Tax=Paxillus rubicundulus Ve08.2h10 TaxID=930991 RepID=A0A0D0CAU4_9AGAM|nr:hypothetical protein PAXRUDRAFT_833825 [Paxillus rubicundulus Ve08.2h10]